MAPFWNTPGQLCTPSVRMRLFNLIDRLCPKLSMKAMWTSLTESLTVEPDAFSLNRPIGIDCMPPCIIVGESDVDATISSAVADNPGDTGVDGLGHHGDFVQLM